MSERDAIAALFDPEQEAIIARLAGGDPIAECEWGIANGEWGAANSEWRVANGPTVPTIPHSPFPVRHSEDDEWQRFLRRVARRELRRRGVL